MRNARNQSRAIVTAALLAAAPGAFAAQADDTSSKQAGAAKTDIQDVQREWNEASKTLASYTYAQRDRALAKGREVLNTMDQRIERLEMRAADEWGDMSKAARVQRQQMLRKLRMQRNAVAEWYGGMKSSSTDAWNEVKRGFVNAYGELSDSFGKASQEFAGNDQSKQQARGG